LEQFLSTETLVIELLLVVSIVAIVVRRLRVPYTVALVVVGLLLTFRQPVELNLTPQLILALFVPPLVFEAAFHLEFRRLRESLVPILVLAVPGVVLTTALIGLIVSVGVGLSLSSALLFGALIAATDPVAVVALFRSLGVPKRLAVVAESESLFNDGTAIVVFNLVLGILLSTTAGEGAAEPFNLGATLVDFALVSVGGLLTGAALGWVVSFLIARIDDYLIETTLTTVLAFGAYLIGEQLHVSGVLAVVAAGIVCGNIGTQGMSPTTRIGLGNFWEFAAFVTNSLVFLLIGLDVNIPQLVANIVPITIAVLAVVASRALVVYGLAAVLNLRRPTLPGRYQHVLFWGGLRGAISLALVLSLPRALADRELLRIMAYGVVLFTLLIQGTTMNLLLRRLGLVERAPAQLEYERRHARVTGLRAASERIEHLYREGLIAADTRERLVSDLEPKIQTAHEAQQALLHEQPSLRDEEHDDARREGLRAYRATLSTLLANGIISEPVYEELVTEVDASLDAEPPNHAADVRDASARKE